MARSSFILVVALASCNTHIRELPPWTLCNSKCVNIRACSLSVECGSACEHIQIETPIVRTSTCIDDCLLIFDEKPDKLNKSRKTAKMCRELHSCEWVECVGGEGEAIDCGLNGFPDTTSTGVWESTNVDYCGVF